MAYTIKKVEVWVGDTLNRPGTLARILEALTEADAQLEFLVARHATEKTTRVFVAPLKGKKQKQAADEVGLMPAPGMNALRIEGPDHKGLGAEISRAVATAGINIRGVSAATLGRKSVIYLAFKRPDEATRAANALRKLLHGKRRK